MAGTYPHFPLNLRKAAQEIFQSVPPIIQGPIRRVRRSWQRTAALLKPGKLARTLAYHGHLFQTGNTKILGLHLGSSNHRIKGFLNIDANPLVDCDVIAGLENLNIPTASVEIIYASHVFEHFPRANTNSILSEWFRVLKPSGTLFLCVPDFELLARMYLENLPSYDSQDSREVVDQACKVLYGGQGDKYDFHYYGYSYPTLKALLVSVGFVRVERFDRKSLRFADFSDGGDASIQNRPTSLNVMAVK